MGNIKAVDSICIVSNDISLSLCLLVCEFVVVGVPKGMTVTKGEGGKGGPGRMACHQSLVSCSSTLRIAFPLSITLESPSAGNLLLPGAIMCVSCLILSIGNSVV